MEKFRFITDKGRVYEIDRWLDAEIIGTHAKIDDRVMAVIMPAYRRNESYAQRIRALIDISAADRTGGHFALPTEILYDEKRNFVGYLRQNVGGKDLELYPILIDRHKQDLSWKNRIRLAINLSAAVHNAHSLGIVIVDLAGSFMKWDETGRITLLECDRFQFTNPNDKKTIYPHTLLHFPKEYIAPEMQVNFDSPDRLYTKESDYFSLAVIIYQLLAYTDHPFRIYYKSKKKASSGSYPILDDEREKEYVNSIRNGRCVLFPETCKGYDIGKDYRNFRVELDEVFPPQICELFRRTFVDGHKDPKKRATAEEWYNALNDLRNNLKKCEMNREHLYHKNLNECPFCLSEKREFEYFNSYDEEEPAGNLPKSGNGLLNRIFRRNRF